VNPETEDRKAALGFPKPTIRFWTRASGFAISSWSSSYMWQSMSTGFTHRTTVSTTTIVVAELHN